MCPKFEQLAAITPKRYKIGCQLVLVTNSKLHTGFRLIPTLMTFNDLEWCNSPYIKTTLLQLCFYALQLVQYKHKVHYCTASMEQATDRAETAAIDELVSA